MGILECCIAKHWLTSEYMWIEVVWNETAPFCPLQVGMSEVRCAQCQRLFFEGGEWGHCLLHT